MKGWPLVFLLTAVGIWLILLLTANAPDTSVQLWRKW